MIGCLESVYLLIKQQLHSNRQWFLGESRRRDRKPGDSIAIERSEKPDPSGIAGTNEIASQRLGGARATRPKARFDFQFCVCCRLFPFVSVPRQNLFYGSEF